MDGKDRPCKQHLHMECNNGPAATERIVSTIFPSTCDIHRVVVYNTGELLNRDRHHCNDKHTCTII